MTHHTRDTEEFELVCDDRGRKFVDEVVLADHRRRKTVVDAALHLAEELVTTNPRRAADDQIMAYPRWTASALSPSARWSATSPTPTGCSSAYSFGRERARPRDRRNAHPRWSFTLHVGGAAPCGPAVRRVPARGDRSRWARCAV